MFRLARGAQALALRRAAPLRAPPFPGLNAGASHNQLGVVLAPHRLFARTFATDAVNLEDPLVGFLDPYDQDPDAPPPGRAWTAAELRKKSSQDLEKIWIVLCKERNMLHSSRYNHRVLKTEMKYPERLDEVSRSMARLKSVVRERDIYNQDLAEERKTQQLESFMRPLPRPPPPPPLELDEHSPSGGQATSA
jgi:ribosomal protein L29